MSITLTKSEIERMKASVLPKIESSEKQQRRAELKEKSLAKVKNWPNTLEALRKKKESFMKDRADKEELKRQEIDKEEAEIRRVARLEAMRKANELLYEQSDKMKMLRSQQLYAEVIHTRGHQIKDKNEEKTKEQIEEQRRHEKLLEQLKAAELEEEMKAKERANQIVIMKKAREEQLIESRQRREEQERINREEGLRMKQRAKDLLLQEARELEEKQRYGEENMKRMLQANVDLEKTKKLMKEKEYEAEQACEVEKKFFEDRKVALKKLEQKRFDEAQKTRQKLIEVATMKLAQANDTEKTILEKQQKDAKDKEEREAAAKTAKLEREWNETVESRAAQIRAKEEHLKKTMAEDEELAKRFRLENEQSIQAEKDKVIRARQQTVAIKTLQFEDGKRLRAEREAARRAELEKEKAMMTGENDDDKRFSEICKDAIQKNVKEGKPVYTLIRALEFTQPPLLAAKTAKM